MEGRAQREGGMDKAVPILHQDRYRRQRAGIATMQ